MSRARSVRTAQLIAIPLLLCTVGAVAITELWDGGRAPDQSGTAEVVKQQAVAQVKHANAAPLSGDDPVVYSNDGESNVTPDHNAHEDLSSDAAIPSQIRVSPAEVEFGRVQSGSVMESVVEITNESNAPLTLKRAKSSCGCTVATPSVRRIGPGDTLELGIRFSVGYREGVRSKTVNVEFEQDVAGLAIPVRAEVIEFVRVSPTAHSEAELGEGLYVIESLDGAPFRILDAQPPVVDNLPSAASCRHEISVNPDSWREQSTPALINLEIDHPHVSTIVLHVSRKHRGQAKTGITTERRQAPRARLTKAPPSLSVVPSSASFGTVVRGEISDPITVTLRGVGDSITDTPAVEFGSPLADLQIVEWSQDGSEVVITLQLAPHESRSGRLRSLAQIHLGTRTATCVVYANIVAP